MLQIIELYDQLLINGKCDGISNECRRCSIPTQSNQQEPHESHPLRAYVEYLKCDLIRQFIMNERGPYRHSNGPVDSLDRRLPRSGRITHLHLICYGLDPRFAHLPLLPESMKTQLDEIKALVESNSFLQERHTEDFDSVSKKLLLSACFNHISEPFSPTNIALTVDEELIKFRTHSRTMMKNFMKENDPATQVDKFDVLQFWNGEFAHKELPILKRVARWVFCMQGIV